MASEALQGKVALVTGGSRGIGRAIAQRLGRDGAIVAVGYARNEQAARQVVERIRSEGGRAFVLPAEFGEHGDAVRLWEAFDAAAAGHAPDGRLDILVNNGAMPTSPPLDSLTEEEFDRVYAVNVRAPLFILKHGIARLRDGGRIINISSGAARIAAPQIMAYASTKAALDIFTLNLAKELGPRGITVNSVAPGFTDTDANAGWLRGNAEGQAYASSFSALGRVAQPEDIADVVGFLASSDARWITGRVLDATGGSGL